MERERAVEPRVRIPGVGEDIMIRSSIFFSAIDFGDRRVDAFLLGEVRVLRRLVSKISVILRCLRIARTVVRPMLVASVTRLCLRGCSEDSSTGSSASSGTSRRTGTIEAGVSDRRLSDVRRAVVVEGGAIRDFRTRFSGAAGGPFRMMFFLSASTLGRKTFGTSSWLNELVRIESSEIC